MTFFTIFCVFFNINNYIIVNIFRVHEIATLRVHKRCVTGSYLLRRSDITNPSIPKKYVMREVWLNCDEVCLYVTTSQGWVEGQGDTWTDDVTYIHTDESYKTDSQAFGNRYHTSNRIGIKFDKNQIRVLMGKLIQFT